MMAKPSECQKQACPELGRRAKVGREANIHKASFTERRLFYLSCTLIPNPSPFGEVSSPLSQRERAGVREYEGLQ